MSLDVDCNYKMAAYPAFLKSLGPDIFSHFLFFQFIFTQLLIKSTWCSI